MEHNSTHNSFHSQLCCKSFLNTLSARAHEIEKSSQLFGLIKRGTQEMSTNQIYCNLFSCSRLRVTSLLCSTVCFLAPIGKLCLSNSDTLTFLLQKFYCGNWETNRRKQLGLSPCQQKIRTRDVETNKFFVSFWVYQLFNLMKIKPSNSIHLFEYISENVFKRQECCTD